MGETNQTKRGQIVSEAHYLFLAVSATDVRESVSHSPLQFITPPLAYTSCYFEIAGTQEWRPSTEEYTKIAFYENRWILSTMQVYPNFGPDKSFLRGLIGGVWLLPLVAFLVAATLATLVFYLRCGCRLSWSFTSFEIQAKKWTKGRIIRQERSRKAWLYIQAKW